MSPHRDGAVDSLAVGDVHARPIADPARTSEAALREHGHRKQDHRGQDRKRYPVAAVALVAVMGLAVAACGSSSSNASKSTTSTTGGVTGAQARVSDAEKAVTDSESALDKAKGAFCSDAKTYITSLDRYAKVFTDSKATVGDVKSAGSDLESPRSTSPPAPRP